MNKTSGLKMSYEDIKKALEELAQEGLIVKDFKAINNKLESCYTIAPNIDEIIKEKIIKNLKEFKISKETNEYILDNYGVLTIKDNPNLINLTEEEKNSIKMIVFPNSIKRINKRAFYGYKNLKEIKLPGTLEYIGDYAFANCKSLEVVHIPKIVIIAKNAFSGVLKKLIFIEINKGEDDEQE